MDTQRSSEVLEDRLDEIRRFGIEGPDAGRAVDELEGFSEAVVAFLDSVQPAPGPSGKVF